MGYRKEPKLGRGINSLKKRKKKEYSVRTLASDYLRGRTCKSVGTHGMLSGSRLRAYRGER